MVIKPITVPSYSGPLFSAIVGVKDRTDRLETMLPSWTRCNKIFDFVIVDWSSKVPVMESQIVREQLEYYPNVKLIRVEDQKHYYRCKALNLARKHTNPRMGVLLKLDVDYVNINHSWMDVFDGNNIWYDQKTNTHEFGDYFVVGCNFSWSSYGFLAVNKWAFDAAGGFNESLLPVWGYEDDELYSKLAEVKCRPDTKNIFKKSHLEKLSFFLFDKYIYHTPHDHDARKANIPEELQTLTLWELAQLNKQKAKENQQISSKYQLLEKNKNYLRFKEV